MTSRQARPRCSPRSRPIATTRTHDFWRRSAASGTSRFSICSSARRTPPRSSTTADAPAVDAVPGLVRRPWHALAKRVKALDEHPVRRRAARDPDPHEARALRGGSRHADRRQARSKLRACRRRFAGGARRRERRAWSQRAGSPTGRLEATPLGTSRQPKHSPPRSEPAAAQLRAGWRTAWEKLAVPELRTWM